MQYARVIVEKKAFEMRKKSVLLETIFGNVYAPMSKVAVEGVGKQWAQILVPCWVFWNKGLNPCQLVNGFVEQVEV